MITSVIIDLSLIKYYKRQVTMKFPHIIQHDEKDCGAACLNMIAEFHGCKYNLAEIRNLIKVDNQGASIYGILEGSKQLHLKSEALEGTPEELLQAVNNNEIKFPFIARIINEENFEHFVVVYKLKNNRLIVGDPAKQKTSKISIATFFEQWQNQIITFEKDKQFKKVNKRKGTVLKYFKYLRNQKKNFALIILISIIISFISIASSTIFDYILEDSSNYDLTVTDYSDYDDEHSHDNHEENSEDYASDVDEQKALLQEAIQNETDDSEYTDETDNDEDLNFFDNIEDKFYKFFAPAINLITQNIDSISLAIIALVIFSGLLQLLRGYILSITSKKIEVPLTLDYHKHLIALPMNFFGTRKTGEVMSRFSDTSSIRSAISSTTLTIVLDSLMAIFIGAYLCSINVTLFFIALATVAVYAVTVIIYRKPIKNINHEILEKDAQVESYLKESIDGIELIKSYQLENRIIKKTAMLFNKLIDKVVKSSLINISLDAIITTITTIGTVCLFWAGTHLCFNNVIEFADLFAFYYLLSSFFTPVGNLIDLQPTFQTAIVAAERLEDVVSVEKETLDGTTNDILNGDIEFNNVNFRYGFRNLILDNINISIKKGQKVALVGESGCGKTTVAKLLMSFYQPESGEIKMNGKNISDIPKNVIRNSISYVPQNSFFFTDTIKNNLKYGNENATDDEIKDICVKCYADNFISEMPCEYNTMLEENATNLSSGQKQRLAIARALLKKPDILIIDEATGNLDAITENNIINTINSATENTTCLIIAHRLTTIKNCDNILFMNNGKIAEQGTHDELMSKNGLYKKYYNAVL